MSPAGSFGDFLSSSSWRLWGVVSSLQHEMTTRNMESKGDEGQKGVVLPVGKKQEFLQNYPGSAWTEGGADALKGLPEEL